jgi:glycosyltransferase involved in cell wall biosynthesis
MGKSKKDTFAKSSAIDKLSIVMPVFNEVRTIESTLNALMALKDTPPIELIVVESNSNDGTREIIQKYEDRPMIKMIYQQEPKGKGNAVRAGMAVVTGDVFLIYDGDDEYDPRDIPSLLRPIQNGQTSFVLGSRHSDGRPMRQFEDASAKSTVMNIAHWIFTKMLNTVYRTRLRDPFTMYKVFRSEVFIGVNLTSNRFDLDWELVGKAVRLGCVPIEVPISYRSRSYSEGKKVRFFYDPITWMVALVKHRFSSLRIDD